MKRTLPKLIAVIAVSLFTTDVRAVPNCANFTVGDTYDYFIRNDMPVTIVLGQFAAIPNVTRSIIGRWSATSPRIHHIQAFVMKYDTEFVGQSLDPSGFNAPFSQTVLIKIRKPAYATGPQYDGPEVRQTALLFVRNGPDGLTSVHDRCTKGVYLNPTQDQIEQAATLIGNN